MRSYLRRSFIGLVRIVQGEAMIMRCVWHKPQNSSHHAGVGHRAFSADDPTSALNPQLQRVYCSKEATEVYRGRFQSS